MTTTSTMTAPAAAPLAPGATRRLGILTIGQAPRADDTVSELRQVLGPGYTLTERGALDGLDRAAVAALGPDGPGDYVLVSILTDGTRVTLAKPKILSLLQRQIDAFNADGVDAILLLCTGTFPRFASERLVVQPQEILYHVVLGLAAGGRRVGVLIPIADQHTQSRAKWAEYGVEPVVAVASPYTKEDEVTPAAREVVAGGADLIFMDCMGYSLPMKQRARAAAGGRPVVLARSAVARVLAEVVE